MINFIIAHLNRLVARLCISLSSGISMFARESETRVVWLNSVVLCRALSRIPNQTELEWANRGVSGVCALTES